jgi:hypothetical protein
MSTTNLEINELKPNPSNIFAKIFMTWVWQNHEINEFIWFPHATVMFS